MTITQQKRKELCEKWQITKRKTGEEGQLVWTKKFCFPALSEEATLNNNQCNAVNKFLQQLRRSSWCSSCRLSWSRTKLLPRPTSGLATSLSNLWWGRKISAGAVLLLLLLRIHCCHDGDDRDDPGDSDRDVVTLLHHHPHHCNWLSSSPSWSRENYSETLGESGRVVKWRRSFWQLVASLPAPLGRLQVHHHLHLHHQHDLHHLELLHD